MGDRPNINERYKIGESLSPPFVDPIPDCAESAYVTGFVPKAIVRVYAGVTELLAEDVPVFGFKEMTLNRPVKQGESITATQTVENITSQHSQPVIVSALPASAVKNTQPDVGDELYECGIIVPVGNLVPGVRVHVDEDGTEVGNEPVSKDSHPVITQPLHAARQVTARQVACEGTDHEVVGPMAAPVTVRAAPSPTPSPKADPKAQIPGNDTVTLSALLVGAGVEIKDQGNSVSTGWYATGPANYFPISQPLTTSSSITATQELCGNVSAPSDPVTPEGELKAVTVLDPICDGSKFVVIRGSTVNAVIVVFRNNSIVGYGGAAPGDVILQLGSNMSLQAGEHVSAIQYMGSTVSPPSNSVTVIGHLETPSIDILGGDPFFWAKAGEDPIEGPVFPRGRGAGPSIRIQACCDHSVRVSVTGPDGKKIAEPELTQLFPGYYRATWAWTSFDNWAVPGGIPVGEYVVHASSDCDQRDASARFYVIFNPADVGGPARFSFHPTAVWFGTGQNSVQGLHYYLHQSDRRVFSIAIKAAGGKTDPYEAAIAVARAEEGLFSYSLDFHTKDVVDLITNFSEAQCADDACCLTALLRAVGIPAHPVTADAGLETGAANWTFDTWTEFLAPYNGSTEWRIFHPHEYPNMLPEPRGVFGLRGVANKSFNDLVVMANESWVTGQLDDGSSDVTYSRNGCKEPEQNISKASWVDELCEAGYWAKAHWDCDGVSARSLRPGNGFRFDESDLRFGGRLAGTLHVVNPLEERHFGRLAVELVAHRPESKGFGEATFGGTTLPLRLDPGEPFSIPFSVELPQTLAPGLELYLRASMNDRTVVLREVRIPARIVCEIEAPDVLAVGDQATIRAVVQNVSREYLRAVDIELEAPFVLDVLERKVRRLEGLEPQETREISWAVRATAGLDSASLRINVASMNGGGGVVHKHFSVSDLFRLEPLPAFTPEDARGMGERQSAGASGSRSGKTRKSK